MDRADAVVSFDGETYRAGYQRSVRHVAIRLGRFETEVAAIAACENRARIDGAEALNVYAGTFTRGTRQHGQLIERVVFDRAIALCDSIAARRTDHQVAE